MGGPTLFSDSWGLKSSDNPIHQAWAFRDQTILANLRTGRIGFEEAQALIKANPYEHLGLLHDVEATVARRKANMTVAPVKWAGGGVEFAGGAALTFGSGGLLVVPGGVLMAHGADWMQAGIRQGFTGEEANSLTQQCATAITGSEEAGFWIDAAIGAVDLLVAVVSLLRNGPRLLAKIRGGASKSLHISDRNLQKIFGKHGTDFGFSGNWNASRADQVRSAINQHVNSPTVRSVTGMYRGQSVIHHVDPNTRLNVISDLNGEVVGGWRLSEERLRSVISTGRLY